MVLQTLNAGCHMQQGLLSTYPLDDCVPSLLLPMPCFGTQRIWLLVV